MPEHSSASAVSLTYLTDASGYRGEAEQLFIPRSEEKVAEILREATRTRTPVTIAGAGTGLTGGRVAHSGWVVSLERLNSIAIHPGYAICGAGALLRDLKFAGQFYPPDPTENSASIGGTVATNASGSRSFLYGDTRRHVRALRVVLMSGEALVLRRGDKPPFELPVLPAPATTKNTAGYYLRRNMDYLDLFIGSEGMLGVVTEIEVTLLPVPRSIFAGVVFFESDEEALDAVDLWRDTAGLRMLEYMDAGSLALLRDIPMSARAALLIEREGDDWSPDRGMDESWFATGAGDRERFRRFRHALPEAVNEIVRRRGLMKMGSDFAVPIARNREMLRIYRETPGEYVIFGHIGDAHLHLNLLPSNELEWARAKELMITFARRAVDLGGTVSAEHGLGKSKRHFLPIQYTLDEIEKMKRVKRMLDPHWLLGQGTLFP